MRDAVEIISSVTTDVSKLMMETSDVSAMLQAVTNDQIAANSALDNIEKLIDVAFGEGSVKSVTDADAVRDSSYERSISVTCRLSELAIALSEIVGNLNVEMERKQGGGIGGVVREVNKVCERVEDVEGKVREVEELLRD